MKLSFQNNVVGLSADTPAEREICERLRASDGHVFQLHVTSDRGMAFQLIGPEDDARRAALNIRQSIEPRFAGISNLALTPFKLDGETYASVEGFWQGLKIADPDRRRAMARLWGGNAKSKGSSTDQPASFEYGGATITAGSPEHWALMRAACIAKFTQNRAARAALLASGDRWLTHRMRRDSLTIPGAIMAEIWMDIRSQLQEEQRT